MSLFAVATVFNMNISEQSEAGDVSLDAIAVMAQAQNGEIITIGPFCAHLTDHICRYNDGYEQEGTFQHQP
jgi:hypothetical protein